MNPKVLHWKTTDELDYAVGQIEVPIPKTKAKLRIRRHVFFVECSYWVLYDEFLSLPPEVEIWENFHFPTESVEASEDGASTFTRMPGEPNLAVYTWPKGWRFEQEEARVWLTYGSAAIPTRLHHYAAEAATAAGGFASLLLPFTGPSPPSDTGIDIVDRAPDGGVMLRCRINGQGHRITVPAS